MIPSFTRKPESMNTDFSEQADVPGFRLSLE